MHTPYILAPVNPLFIALSLLVGLLLNLAPWGNTPFVPEFLLLVIIFWNMHAPRHIQLGSAFFAGMCMDVANATILGQNALAYTLIAYIAGMIYRHVLWFSPLIQTAYILPLLLLFQTIQLIVQFFMGANFPHWWYFSPSLAGAALWPMLRWILLAWQGRNISSENDIFEA